MKRPRPFRVGDVRLRVIRGPRDGAWYWQATLYRSRGKQGATVWTGWASRDGAMREVAALVTAGQEAAAPARDRTAPVVTVRDLLETWLADRQDTAKPETFESDLVAAKRLAAGLGDVRVDRVQRPTLEHYTAARRAEGYAPATVALDLFKLRAAWRWGRELGHVPDVELSVPRFKVEPVRPRRTPTPAEVDAVLAAVEARGPRWVVPALLLLAETGARRGEACGLRWGAVDSERRTLTLRGKTGTRTVPVSPALLLVLRGLGVGGAEDRVWPVTDKTFDRYLGCFLARACRDAGVPEWTPHGFRRFVATRLLDSGIPIHTARQITGHSATTMLRYYAAATEEGMRSAVERAGLGERSARPPVSATAPRRR